MTIQIDGRSMLRATGVVAATIGVGAAAFFGGQTTRLSDDARASERQDAVQVAVEKVENENAVELAGVKQDAREHEKRAVKKAVKKERKRAEKQAERARNEGYSAGNSAGYGAGHSAGYSEGEDAGYSDGSADGYSDGSADGYEDGLDDASDEVTCSDDPDVPLPYC
jgi:hypothetical protein